MLNKNTKIAIANRGEVAHRIHRAIKKLGGTSVLLHSKPDKNSIAYRVCDETKNIGDGPSSDSYLNIDSVIKGALESGAQALHPGFGFLSENADFARACAKNKILFIGPSPESMDLFGDKISAKTFCEKENIPTLKSYRESDQTTPRLKKEASQIGYPVLIKAAAGGGGRGMRIVHKESELEGALSSAKSESLKAFGSDTVFLEKYLAAAKHIEVQVFGAHNNEVFILGERECSVQRRHQKIIEEALSPSLSEEQRKRVYSYARSLAQKSKYLGAGTVEFLFDGDDFYFLEVNTRLQVEHPVTEEVFGVDLVEAQIKTAFSQALFWKQENLKPKNHSIECRIYAEDLQGFPSIGKIGSLIFGHNHDSVSGLRIESGFERGDEITPHYDSMIAKVICTDTTRTKAISKTLAVLESSIVTGLYTNIPLLMDILKHPKFIDATMNTDFFKETYPNGLTSPWDQSEIDLITRLYLAPAATPNSVFTKNWRPTI